MSELKAHDLVDIQDYRGEVYFKSEADKVISELKSQKAQAKDDCVFWKKKYNDCKRELDLLKDTNAFYNGGRQ